MINKKNYELIYIFGVIIIEIVILIPIGLTFEWDCIRKTSLYVWIYKNKYYLLEGNVNKQAN